MNRIFLTLAIVSNSGLAATFLIGWFARTPSEAAGMGLPLSVHILTGLGALTLAMLVHAIVLTYFMGTGRWIEETSHAYRLAVDARTENIRLKYQTLPCMVGVIVLIVVTGAFGAAADPGAALGWPAAKTVHMLLACSLLMANVVVSIIEYHAIQRNGRLIDGIMDQVQTIRRERGLKEPVEARSFG